MVVGTEGCAGKTSVILSSMLSHHRTNGRGGVYSPKTRDGKRYQLACDLLLLLVDKCHPLCLTSSKGEGKRDGNSYKVREQICQVKIKHSESTQHHDSVLNLKPPFRGLNLHRFQARTRSE